MCRFVVKHNVFHEARKSAKQQQGQRPGSNVDRIVLPEGKALWVKERPKRQVGQKNRIL